MISWKELRPTIDCHIIAYPNQPWIFYVNIVIKKHILAATSQRYFESKIADKRWHQIQEIMNLMNNVNKHLVKYAQAYLIC